MSHIIVKQWEGRTPDNRPQAAVQCSCGWKEKAFSLSTALVRWEAHRQGIEQHVREA